MQISSLYIYPIKSCAGTSLSTMEIGPRGPKYDREWMVVDEAGKFVSQRNDPKMALIKPALEAESIKLSAKGMSDLQFSLDAQISSALKPLTVQVWDSDCQAFEVSAEVSQWFSNYLGSKVRLVRMSKDFVRPTSPKRGPGQVGFADGYPFLLTSEESLNDLNQRLSAPITMDRFRPNIVVKGETAFDEDRWSELQLGEAKFRVVKKCARCKMITVDQSQGKIISKEPLIELGKFRREDNKILFGMNLIHESSAVGLRLSEGQPGVVLS